MPVDPDAEARRRYRAFIRAHHPDAGGDPEVFAAGLARLRARLGAGQRPGGRGTRERERPDRFDAPVVVVRGSRGLGGVVRRVRSWYRRKRRTRVR